MMNKNKIAFYKAKLEYWTNKESYKEAVKNIAEAERGLIEEYND